MSSRTVEALIADPSRLRRVLFPSSSETVIDDEVLITIDGLPEVEAALAPPARVTQLGAVLGDIDGAPARGLTSADVRKVATQLALARVELAGELAEAYQTLKDFVTETAKAEAGMIVYSA